MQLHVPRRLVALSVAVIPVIAAASSHREAPDIAGRPRVDGTDFYMFRSYEPGRSAFITVLANYIPFQDPFGGPNFYSLDPNAIYRIHLINNGGTQDTYTFDFRFTNTYKNLAVNAGGKKVAIPLINDGPVTTAATNLNEVQSYTVTVKHNGERSPAQNLSTGGSIFYKPVDNIGEKSIPNYPEYAGQFIYSISIPGCTTPGRVFVGQRKEGFVVNLGEIFDLVNLNPIEARNAEPNSLHTKNITSIALELPIACVASKSDPVIGGYTTASLTRADGDQDENNVQPGWSGDDERAWRQVSRLGMPLVNEVVIGLPDKDKFNASHPSHDVQFLTYVTNPSLPVLLNVLFGNAAVVPGTPRNDLVAAFLTGVKGLNQPIRVEPSEMLRLNTSTPVTAPASQSDLGVLGGDLAGFPNGRRPYDDVTTITLRVAEGALCGKIGSCGSESSDPNHGAPYTDGVQAAGPDAGNLHLGGAIFASDTYLPSFPYLNNPLPGSPNGPNGIPTASMPTP